MAALTTPVDYDAWLAAETAYCKRLSARITTRVCLENQQLSTGEGADLRCVGCNGLHDQTPPPLPRPCLVTVPFDSRQTEEPVSTIHEAIAADIPQEAPETFPDECFDLSELTLDISPEIASQILEQNPALARKLLEIQAEEDELGPECPEPDDSEDDRPRAIQDRRSRSGEPRRVSVFQGRCIRCGGYMVNALERHEGIRDDEIYRCLSCGWRTSPTYEANRKNPGLARPWGGEP